MKHDIKAENLLVEYSTLRGNVRALDCPSFSVSSGESVAVMGTSGCGKSTLLGLLAGLAIPSTGTIRIGEVILSELEESKRIAFRKQMIGMVYQADNLLPYLTVAENLELQLTLTNDTKDVRKRIETLLSQLGLMGLEDRLPDQLSGGQRQRVAIARAIIHQPQIILADEPTGALDDTNAENVIRLLLTLHKKLAATLVVVTHDPKVAAMLERTITLTSGRTKN